MLPRSTRNLANDGDLAMHALPQSRIEACQSRSS